MYWSWVVLCSLIPSITAGYGVPSGGNSNPIRPPNPPVISVPVIPWHSSSSSDRRNDCKCGEIKRIEETKLKQEENSEKPTIHYLDKRSKHCKAILSCPRNGAWALVVPAIGKQDEVVHLGGGIAAEKLLTCKNGHYKTKEGKTVKKVTCIQLPIDPDSIYDPCTGTCKKTPPSNAGRKQKNIL